MDRVKKIIVIVLVSLINSFLLMEFPEKVLNIAIKYNCIKVETFKHFRNFVNICNSLAIFFFFVALIFAISLLFTKDVKDNA